ncbi:MAG: hypothetical protein AB1714_08000 [Acidobacteriota bacterium]
MDRTSRLIVLLALLAAVIAMAFSQNRASVHLTQRARTPPRYVPMKSVPVVRGFPETPANPPDRCASHRNPFKYADEPETPPYVPPPPPPPPPDIKPESRFLGTIYMGEPFALFSLKNEVTPLRQGEVLEEKYTITQIDSESVLLEDTRYMHTAMLSLGKS